MLPSTPGSSKRSLSLRWLKYIKFAILSVRNKTSNFEINWWIRNYYTGKIKMEWTSSPLNNSMKRCPSWEASSRSAARGIHHFLCKWKSKTTSASVRLCSTFEKLEWNRAGGGAFRWGSALQAKRSQVRFLMRWFNCSRPHYGPGVD